MAATRHSAGQSPFVVSVTNNIRQHDDKK